MLALGVLAGFLLGPQAKLFKPVGEAFIRLLKMLIVPLVFFTLVSGVTKMESPKALKKIGGFIVVYYLFTSMFAAAVGTIISLILRPGLGVQGLLGNAPELKVAKYSVVESLLNWIPTNPIQAMAEMNMLQIIFFALLVGITLLLLQERVSHVTKLFNQASDVVIRITELVMEVAPYGIFALVAEMVGTLGSKMLAAVGKFVLADYLSILVMLTIIYPLLLKVISRGKVPVIKFYRHIFPAMVVAASTTSSAATLPVEMKVAGERLGLPERIYGFTLPLGNTTNMDGMAAAIGVISVFALDIYNIPIAVGLIVQIIYLGLVLSIGAAGVKGAGIVMSAVLFEALGIPMSLLPILAAIWPVIDIPHTTTNVTGDIVGTTLCATNYGELDWEVFNRGKNAAGNQSVSG
jgi:Na+/H+-dicarboxylate symporter